MSFSSKTTSTKVPAGYMKHPHFFPGTRLVLEECRCAINTKVDALLDKSIPYISTKMGEISRKVKKLLSRI